MAKNAKFQIMGKLGAAGGRPSYGTVVIQRADNVVFIRRKRSRQVYMTTLDAMAESAVWKLELAAKRERDKARKAKRRGR